MRVLIACEFSGRVRDAFIAAGHDAVSCDLLPSESPGPHIVGDAIRAAHDFLWDLMIAFPPCTFLCNSGVKHLYQGGRLENGPDPDRWEKMYDAAVFFLALWHAPIMRICIENPIMHRHGAAIIKVRQAQIIQPYDFGHPETKATCLWLKGLPKLTLTEIVPGRLARVHRESPSPDRWKKRSITYSGIASAMASQWNPKALAQFDELLDAVVGPFIGGERTT